MTEGESDDQFESLRADEDRALVQLLLDHGRDQLWLFVLGGLSGAVAIALELLPSYVLGVAIDALFTGERSFSLVFVPQGVIPTTQEEQFFFATGLIGVLYVSSALLSWANSWSWNRFSQVLQHDVRVDAYDAMQRLELAFFDEKQTGEVMSVLNNDVNQLEDFLTTSLNNAIRIAVRFGVIAAIMLALNWQLALVALLTVPILAVVSRTFVRIIQPKYKDVRSSVGALNARLENNVGGIEVVKAYTNEEFEADRVESASEDYLDAQWDAISSRVKFFPTLRLLTAAGYVVTFLVGGWWVIFGPPLFFSGSLSAGVLVTFLLFSRRFRYPMRRFGEIINDYQYAEAASERILGLLSEPRTIPDPSDGGRTDDPEVPDLTDVEGHVEYDGVEFAYDDDVVVEDVSFTVEPGEMVGLVGPTGAGKTTLAKLLLRFYDVDRGGIRVDGHDVRDVPLADLRASISYVSQEPYLFHGTVRENVAYGDPDASDEAVIEAAKTAGAHEFVTRLPDGYDTVVGERGVKLSGGQRQRVSIARAILTDPDVLVLDEATSHVDNETEVLIQNNLEAVVADRTTFAVAHRLSTVRDADRILVLDEGRLVEEGTHDELLAQDGLYANLWSVQVGEVDALPSEFVERARRRADLDD